LSKIQYISIKNPYKLTNILSAIETLLWYFYIQMPYQFTPQLSKGSTTVLF